MNRKTCQEGIDAWKRIKAQAPMVIKQAELDIESADIFIEALKNKMKSLPKEEEVKENGK